MMRFTALAVFGLALSAVPAGAATLTVQVTGVESGEGQVFVGLCPTSFEESTCTAGKRQPARPGAMRFSFPGVPAGRYAIAVYHDVNANGRLDKQIFGLPAEPYGFSNDVGRSAPPSFEGALVPVGDPAATVSVRLGRMSLTR